MVAFLLRPPKVENVEQKRLTLHYKHSLYPHVSSKVHAYGIKIVFLSSVVARCIGMKHPNIIKYVHPVIYPKNLWHEYLSKYHLCN